MIRHDVPGAELTTLRVGGVCRTVIDIASETELVDALRTHPDAITVGGGSNLLIADDGFDGTVIRSHTTSDSGLTIDADAAIIKAEAPVDWDHLVQVSIAAGLQGLEATSGVPGSVGGGVVQNLGAYGQEMADVIVSVDVWDRREGRPVTFSRDDCEFAYRTSRFKHDSSRRFVITSALLQFERRATAPVRYGDVSELLATRHGHDGPYELAQIRDAIIEVRTAKGMVLGASAPSAGSFFTNPVLDGETAAMLERRGFRINTRPDGVQLVSAATLLEAAGYHRGHRKGRAGLSEQHVLALVNLGDATTNEVVDLALEIRDSVRQHFEVTLRPEPVMLGFAVDPFAS